MSRAAKADWIVPAALLALGALPMLAGAFRLVQLGAVAGGVAGGIPGDLAGVSFTTANVHPVDGARFIAAPVPVVLHILSATLYGVFGAWQFAPGLRRSQPGWHRAAGRALVPLGLLAALTGLWMTLFYPVGTESPARFDGPAVFALRLLAGTAMAVSLCLGLAAVLKRDIPRHRAWMLRAYALGLGAGTQVFTHLPWFLFPSIQGEAARALFMGAGWVINLAVAEWLIWSSFPALPSSPISSSSTA
jgi:uncharacterized membrane protein